MELIENGTEEGLEIEYTMTWLDPWSRSVALTLMTSVPVVAFSSIVATYPSGGMTKIGLLSLESATMMYKVAWRIRRKHNIYSLVSNKRQKVHEYCCFKRNCANNGSLALTLADSPDCSSIAATTSVTLGEVSRSKGRANSNVPSKSFRLR